MCVSQPGCHVHCIILNQPSHLHQPVLCVQPCCLLYLLQPEQLPACNQTAVVVQMCPEHFVGRLGQVVGKLCCGATKEASALLQPRPQVLGPLGIVHLLEAVTNAIIKCEARQEQVMHAACALSQNSTATQSNAA